MRRRISVLACLLVVLVSAVFVSAADRFRRGDANTTGGVDISDPIWLLGFLFSGGESPKCPDAADFNDDGRLDIGDSIYGLGWLFFGNDAPPAPGPFSCGEDPSADRLDACVDETCGASTSCLDLSFARSLPAILDGTPKDGFVEDALDARSTSAEHEFVLGKLAAPAEETILLETLDGEGGLYTFFLAQVRDGGTRLEAATNIAPLLEPGGVRAGEPGAIVEVTVAIDATLRAALSGLHGYGATTGGGGVDDVLDGTTTLLSVESSAACVQHALYGLAFPVHDGRLEIPPHADESARYLQSVAAWDLWIGLFAPTPLPIVAGGIAGPLDDVGAGAIAGAAPVTGLCITPAVGDEDFAEEVVAALTAIAPCFFYEVTADGQVLLQSPADFEAFCECYKQHLAGMNLVADIALGEGKTTIERTSGGNVYRPSSDEVGYNPDRMNGGQNSEGNTARPPEVGLAHELIHALHDRNGSIDLDGSRTDGVLDEEITTVRGENQIRGELGEPDRTHYGSNEVPDATDDHLDESNRYDCPCPEGDGDGEGDGEGVVDGEGDEGGDSGDGDAGAGDPRGVGGAGVGGR